MEPTTHSAIPAYFAALVRALLSFGGGYLVAKGWITTEQLPEVGGAVLALIALIWSFSHKASVQNAIKAAQDASKGYQP